MRVYIAGPIGQDPKQAKINMHYAIEYAHQLRDRGYSPFVPQLSVVWHKRRPRMYEDWLTMDFDWIEVCDALLRIPGESPGADREVEFARKLGIPVYFSVEALVAQEGRGDGC